MLSLFLALLLTLQCVCMGVSAAPEDDPDTDDAASSETTAPEETVEGTDASVAASTPEGIGIQSIALPEETEPAMPAGFTGDASVEYGCRTLDARRPLAGTEDYTAKASAALLYDLNSDTLVFAQDVDAKLYPASLTKVMTCLLTIEMQQDLDAVVTVTSAGLQGMEPGSSSASLKVDEQMTVRDLLYCLMVKSANDAASVLAVYNSGSISAFVDAMNQRAQELGCTGTHYVNPHGLHDDEHYTTARDLAKIMCEAMKHPIFEEIFSTAEYTVGATNLSEARELKTTNYLIRNAGYPTVLDSRVIGGKTGYTSKAGRCLIAVSEKNGMKLLSVVLGTKAVYGADGYSFIRYGNFEETSNLLDFAYDAYTTMEVLAPSQVAGQFAVAGGDHNAFGTITSAMSASIPQGSDYNTIRYEYALTEGSLTAPVQKNQQIGVIRVWYGDICLAQQTLLSASDVEVAQKTKDSQKDDADASQAIWNTILLRILAVVAVLFVLVVFLRIRAAAKRRRRRRNARRRRSPESLDERRRRQ